MNAVTTYDFTSFNTAASPSDIQQVLETHCREWCFQQEKCPLTGTLHFQGRFILGVKRRLKQCVELMKGCVLEGCHLSVTSTANRGNMFYVLKPESRVNGPWSSQMESSAPFIPSRVREFLPRPWQAAVITKCAENDDRTVHVVYDPDGNTGKTTLMVYLAVHQKASMIPPINDHRDLMRIVMDKPKSAAYVIDIPRAMDKKKLNLLWAALETVKGGYAYDDRYKFREMFFEPPNIVVFTNVLPAPELLSPDRWMLHQIIDGALVQII